MWIESERGADFRDPFLQKRDEPGPPFSLAPEFCGGGEAV